ncbi:MAG: TIGR03905 family TSCPD domain-containing protein [Clostridiales bacterium]|nr:TIGR03905 family TSCPD domain-containing protein [Clostridiales bacterium]
MQYVYNTKGTCSSQIIIDIDEHSKIENVTFIGGCNGNTKGISQLVKGMNIDDVIARLEGTTCGFRSTSCPDQLATALKQIKEKQN